MKVLLTNKTIRPGEKISRMRRCGANHTKPHSNQAITCLGLRWTALRCGFAAAALLLLRCYCESLCTSQIATIITKHPRYIQLCCLHAQSLCRNYNYLFFSSSFSFLFFFSTYRFHMWFFTCHRLLHAWTGDLGRVCGGRKGTTGHLMKSRAKEKVDGRRLERWRLRWAGGKLRGKSHGRWIFTHM